MLANFRSHSKRLLCQQSGAKFCSIYLELYLSANIVFNTFPTFKKVLPYLLVVNHEKNAIFARLLQHIAVSAFLQDALLEQCSNHRRNEPCRA